MTDNVVQELINKTFRELKETQKPQQRSRISRTPNGYIHLVAWSNACLLRVLVRRFTDVLPKSLYRLKTQLDDAARSTVANIEEGYSRPTTTQYLDFLGYSYASLHEVKGDLERSRQDGLLASLAGSNLTSLSINLTDWHEALKRTMISRPISPKKEDQPKYIYTALATPDTQSQIATKSYPLKSFKFLYPPVDNLRARDLTYEVFIELINKTDWHLRRLVESLEDKLNRDQQFYQVEKARVQSKLKIR